MTPPFQTPDEYGHYDYVLYLSRIDWLAFLTGDVARPTGYNDVTTHELWAVTAATGTESHLRGQGLRRPLPHLREQLAAGRGSGTLDTHEELSRKTVVAPQFNYPVLYYGGLSVLVRVLRWQAVHPVLTYHIVRSTSLLFLLLTVWTVWHALRLGFARPDDDWAIAAGTAFVALQPQLTMLGTSVQSDILTVLLTTAGLAFGLSGALSGARRQWLAGGVIVGGLLLVKLHAAVALLAAFSLLLGLSAYHHRSIRHLRALALLWLVSSVMGGWWYVRAYVLYGSYTGMVGNFRTAPFGTPKQNVRWWLEQWPLTFDSFWGMWGWLEVPLPSPLYGLLGLLSVATVSMGLLALYKRRQSLDARRPPVAFVVGLLAAYACIMVAVAALVGPVHNNQGRHWLPIIGVFAMGVATAASRSSMWQGLTTLTWTAVLGLANWLLLIRTSRFYW